MLTDFGVALLRSLDPVRADSSRAFGTPHYMSPEQAAGELDIDGRSDLYSIGVLGYYMLSGVLPFDGATFEALAAKHIAEPHVPLARLAPDAPAELCAAIERCLTKDRDVALANGPRAGRRAGAVTVRRRWFGAEEARCRQHRSRPHRRRAGDVQRGDEGDLQVDGCLKLAR